MKVKDFKTYLRTRLDENELAHIEVAAQLEAEAFRALQEDIAKAVVNYMAESNIGFNELVKRLGKSPTQVSKIIKGEANLTLATVAQLFAMMNRKPHLAY